MLSLEVYQITLKRLVILDESLLELHVTVWRGDAAKEAIRFASKSNVSVVVTPPLPSPRFAIIQSGNEKPFPFQVWHLPSQRSRSTSRAMPTSGGRPGSRYCAPLSRRFCHLTGFGQPAESLHRQVLSLNTFLTAVRMSASLVYHIPKGTL
jgi:hypothetical protein